MSKRATRLKNKKAKRILPAKITAFCQLCICHREKTAMIRKIIPYKSHFSGSRMPRDGSIDNRRLFRGEIFLTEINGNKAKNTVIISPRPMPWAIAGKEIVVVG